MNRSARGCFGLVFVAGLAGCGGGGGTQPPPLTACNTAGGQNVTLAVAAYQAIAPLANAGCLLFPGNASTTDSALYLLVPQLATDSQGGTAAFILNGDTLHPALAAAMTQRQPVAPDLGMRFHDFLRTTERTHWAALGGAQTGAVRAALLRGPPDTLGNVRNFRLCGDLNCTTFPTVTATAKSVSGHVAIYVDNAAPAGGLTQTDLDSLASLFNARLYAIDTTAFGRESDIDNNGVVIVLMSNVVNQLVTRQQCHQGGFVAGFFFGADIDPLFKNDPRVNHGEVFYSIVADPDSTLSCRHSVNGLRQLVPVTFIHEFQHMISYNQHVLVRSAAAQVTWLDEGMSHFAEELGGRSFLPGNDSMFSNFAIGDIRNAYQFLDSSEFHFMAFSSGIGSLAERGAAWLMVRYFADQFAADTSFTSVAAVTRSLEQSTQQGGAALATVSGTPFTTIAERWILANYVSDLPGFTAPPELRYRSWSFRTTYASLNAQCPSFTPPCPFPKPFPLTPLLFAGRSISASGTLHAGSGTYAVGAQPPSSPGFALLFSGPGGAALPSVLNPRLNVVRIR
ncbi:MAG TPA: hypothetical protein VFP39_17615 [Gemmatimonadales bacterium]|nr:hypothetical protein [Gemmatimonadales bacterium]